MRRIGDICYKDGRRGVVVESENDNLLMIMDDTDECLVCSVSDVEYNKDETEFYRMMCEMMCGK